MKKKKVRVLNKDYQVEKFSVEDRLSVVIADMFESREELSDVVEKLGYESFFCEDQWPRDRINSFNDCYIARKSSCEGRRLGEGGCFVFGKDYAVLSDDIYDSKSKSYSYFKRKLMDILNDFFRVPIHTVKSYASRFKLPPHLDLTVLPIPQKDILIVDSRHYKQQKKRFEEIAKVQEQKLVVAENCQWWACNCLVLEKEGNPVIVTNKKTKNFQKLLSRLNLDYVGVLSHISPIFGGSIRCRTNVAANPDLFPYLGLKIE